MNIHYKELDESELDSITELDKLCFKLNWSKALFQSELQSPFAKYYIAVIGNDVIGYCGIQTVLDEGNITNIAVHPDFRKNKIATELMQMIINYGKSKKLSFITLEVRESNKNAINLYEKYGFKVVGKRKNYYSDNRETALLMTKYM